MPSLLMLSNFCTLSVALSPSPFPPPGDVNLFVLLLGTILSSKLIHILYSNVYLWQQDVVREINSN